MTPSVVGDKRQRGVFGFQPSVFRETQRLCLRLDCFDGCVGNRGVTELESGLLVDERAHDVEIVVGPFGTIDNRSSLDGNHPTVGLHFV